MLGPALLGLSTPAYALDPYPGETREAFVARAAAEQQRKLAEADAAAGAAAPGFATAGGGSSGGGLRFGAFGLAMLVLGGLRMSRGIFRASRVVTKASGFDRAGESFEDRLADKLRELERQQPAPTVEASPPAAAPIAPRPPAAFATGPRTFGRRAS